jgi:glycosyltransferase involved in cell wall biosynthesis
VFDFSIIIPTRNRPQSAFDLVQYLRDTLMCGAPIFLIDQSDDRGDALKEYFHKKLEQDITHITESIQNTSAARNHGASLANSRWLVFLDDDVRPERNYFQRIAAYLEENAWVDVVQPNIIQRDEWVRYQRNPDEWIGQYLDQHRTRRMPQPGSDGVGWFMTSLSCSYDTPVLCLGSGAFVISRDTFFKSGGFDENLPGIGEDREFTIRLWWYGYRLQYLPSAVAFHLREKEGGLRLHTHKSLGSRIFIPEPDPGILYFYLKWFPGHPTLSFCFQHLKKASRNPFKFPIKLIRLGMSFNLARRRLLQPPGTINHRMPIPRNETLDGI